MDLSNVNTLLETGGSIVALCGVVYFIIKYIMGYLEKRDSADAAEREKLISDHAAERKYLNDLYAEELKHIEELHKEENLSFCNTLHEMQEKLIVLLDNKDTKD